MSRTYEESHPWINFTPRQTNDVHPRLWMLLGEARSKCEHLAGTPLKPAVAEELNLVTLIKGALATTAIEGNTLSEEQVGGIIAGTYSAPPSRHYQEVEVRNVIDALQRIDADVQAGKYPRLSVDTIRGFNRQVLAGLDDEVADGAVPGELRTHSVTVGPYRGAPAEDCDYLLGRLCDWLEGPDFQNSDVAVDFSLMLTRAVMAHLYLAWIHPFGDGNGRTARLVEYMILARSGKVPLPAAHLLSNHYNLTRDQYYRELDRASKTSNIVHFVAYAVEGFVDGIRNEIDTVRHQQLDVAWVNYVRETMDQYPSGKVVDRQLEVLLAMESGRWYKREEVEFITPSVARQYGQAGERMVARDLNRLAEAGLVAKSIRNPTRYRARFERMQAFLPPMAPPHDDLDGPPAG